MYKAPVRSIITYALEKRAKTQNPDKMLKTNQLKVVRKVVGKTKVDAIRNNKSEILWHTTN